MMLLVLTSVRPGQGQLEGMTAFALVTTYLSSFVDWQAREQPPAEK